ncbi:MAG: tetratricopeptide repeat protein [Alphaproteobacteria bacterium]|nr:tetratricopeptide repeat protein [Alphaproteobacteria bacterium]
MFRDRGKIGAAITHFEHALALAPNRAEVHNIWATPSNTKGRLDEAMACYERALVLKPDYPRAHYGRSLLLLLLGDFARGWAEYEWRSRCRGNPERGYPTRPQWSGEPFGCRNKAESWTGVVGKPDKSHGPVPVDPSRGVGKLCGAFRASAGTASRLGLRPRRSATSRTSRSWISHRS